MGRPRYHVNTEDWLDCLDWLDYQCMRADWYAIEDHPAQTFGIVKLKHLIRQWRSIVRPTKNDLSAMQNIMLTVLLADDWSRLRKALSARRRRRRESQESTKPINITLTQTAHDLLSEYRDLTASSTLSTAIETGLKEVIEEARRQKEQHLEQQIRELLESKSPKAIVNMADQYLANADSRKTLANSCRFALQLFRQTKDQKSFQLVKERLLEDLVWNELHLNISFKQVLTSKNTPNPAQ